MEVVIFDGLALKEELILERRGSHSGLMLGPAAFLFMIGSRVRMAECSIKFS